MHAFVLLSPSPSLYLSLSLPLSFSHPLSKLFIWLVQWMNVCPVCPFGEKVAKQVTQSQSQSQSRSSIRGVEWMLLSNAGTINMNTSTTNEYTTNASFSCKVTHSHTQTHTQTHNNMRFYLLFNSYCRRFNLFIELIPFCSFHNLILIIIW